MGDLKLDKSWEKPLLYKLDVLNTQAACDPLKIAVGTDGQFDGATPCNAFS
jgi:hypothetical protein